CLEWEDFSRSLLYSPDDFKRTENRNDERYYSIIALVPAIPGKFPNHQEIRFMEGVNKFLEGEEWKTDFFETYEQWYQYVSRRLIHRDKFNINMIYSGYEFKKHKYDKDSSNGYTQYSGRYFHCLYSSAYILHKTNTDKALEMNKDQDGDFTSMVPEGFRENGEFITLAIMAETYYKQVLNE
uniref:Uncharacterized protein n=1 Tax=Clytia hemisphaerica TaxID=252671 RepID=A0A7M5UJ49_9CNID